MTKEAQLLPWRSVHHIALVTPDLDETVRFYRDVLGMSVGQVSVQTAQNTGQRHLFINLGGTDGHAIPRARRTPFGGPTRRGQSIGACDVGPTRRGLRSHRSGQRGSVTKHTPALATLEGRRHFSGGGRGEEPTA